MATATLASHDDATATTEIPTYEAMIIGGGISGMYLSHRLRELGVHYRVFEAGSDIGGTWYWCRYPGARFDSESWTYGFFFDEELLQEWDWKEHFSPQPDTLEYLNHVADKFDFRRDMTFNASVAAAEFDDATSHWTITLEDGRQARAPLLITGLGVLSAPTLPNIPGRDDFEGPCFHTARWPHEPVDFAGKRVGIIGTGATAIQAIPEIAKTADYLTVFQRHPNWAAPLHNARITPEEQKDIKARYREIYARCWETVACFIHHPDPRSALEVSAEEREAFWEKLYSEPGFGIWLGNFRDVLTDERANALATEFMARKIRERVNDPVLADKLTPKNHGFGTRRLPLESGYFEAYNRPNVRLVDLNETPIERVTPTGVRTPAEEHELDILIYATGFDGVTGPYDRIDIRGPGGRRLKDDWKDLPRTYLGVINEGFPNLLMVLGPHTARGNIPRNIEMIVDFNIGIIRHMREHGYTRVEARPEEAEKWLAQVKEVDALLLSSKIPSWQTGVNQNVPGRQTPRILGYNGGAVRYRKITERVAAGGYKELKFR
jgi:cation diffusion facilitator CzcD-associated flavoprotein CzcO